MPTSTHTPERPADDSQHPPILHARGLSRSFPGVKALDRVDFELRRGEIHALMGENGAGKSTLINALTGVYPPDEGEILLDRRPVHPRSPAHAQSLGITTVYQEINLVPELSVAENIMLGRQPRRLGCIDWRALRNRARAALARLEVDVDPARTLASCSIAVQQMVAIARALDISAKVLILDEPTSSLDAAETEELFRVMRRLRDAGLGVVFVTHFIDQVYAVADRITVLRNGRLVGTHRAAELPRLELVSKMIGRDASELSKQNPRRIQPVSDADGGYETILRARGLGRRRAIEPFDLDIREAEIVGLAGLLGSGRTETARLLFGLDRPDRGGLTIHGREQCFRSPRDAIARGLAFLPEDRKTEGVFPRLSLRENIIIALQARRGWRRTLSFSKQRDITARFIKTLRISTTSTEKSVRLLSGGNQQKVVLARWLATEPVLLILDEPTRGVDVGAKAEIESLIESLRERGMGIVFISSELDEVVRHSTRVIVIRDRRHVAELRGDDVREDRVLRLIASAEEEEDAPA